MTSSDTPFSTIESAQEFLGLLDEAIDEAMDEARRELSACAARQQQRQVEAWRLVLYKMRTLSSDVTRSRRLMGELRRLRNLLHRTAAAAQADAVHVGAVPSVESQDLQPPGRHRADA
jgi:hypothetical protein